MKNTNKNPFLTTEEFRALCRALSGGMLDKYGGMSLRREQAIDEIRDAQEHDEGLYAEDVDNLDRAMEKLTPLSNGQFEEIIELVNKRYDLAVYEALSDMMEDDDDDDGDHDHHHHICDDCRSKAPWN